MQATASALAQSAALASRIGGTIGTQFAQSQAQALATASTAGAAETQAFAQAIGGAITQGGAPAAEAYGVAFASVSGRSHGPPCITL